MEVAYRLDFAVCNNNNNSGAALNVSRVKGKWLERRVYGSARNSPKQGGAEPTSTDDTQDSPQRTIMLKFSRHPPGLTRLLIKRGTIKFHANQAQARVRGRTISHLENCTAYLREISPSRNEESISWNPGRFLLRKQTNSASCRFGLLFDAVVDGVRARSLSNKEDTDGELIGWGRWEVRVVPSVSVYISEDSNHIGASSILE